MFPDGAAPPPHVIYNWLNLVEGVFSRDEQPFSAGTDILVDQELRQPSPPPGSAPTIAVHCIAGLGRAPILVAIALIEYGMDALDSVYFIRQKRRGAINQKQLQFLESYYSKRKKPHSKACFLM